MRKFLLGLWLIVSAFFMIAAILLSYMSVMMGNLHWDWFISLGLGAIWLAIAFGCFWMSRRALRLLRAP